MGETNATPKLRLQGVSKSFLSPRATSPTLAVSDISLDIGSGEFVCIVGPSGCGKSTVLNMIAGLEPQDAGAIELDGRAVQGPGAERGVMFQDYAPCPGRPWRRTWVLVWHTALRARA